MHPQMQELLFSISPNISEILLFLEATLLDMFLFMLFIFNNLNYLTIKNKCTKAINLTDDILVSKNEEDAKEKLNFLKKQARNTKSDY